jgi:2-amino-4-hydroxy-6-hydroxymethyldihydropteridine diphosphokinase
MNAIMRQAFVAMGSNLGDRPQILRGALARLEAELTVLAVSRVYETDPVGVVDQPAFLNLVVGVETTLTPENLLQLLLRIEAEFGRVRVQRWGPRTLDLDLLAYENETRAGPDLELPHPRMFERAFVTVPLREVLATPSFRRESWGGLQEKLKSLPLKVTDRGVRPINVW